MIGPSKSQSVLEQNVINSLDAVPLLSIRRYVSNFPLVVKSKLSAHKINHSFAVRSAQFIDAYQKGLNGVQAAWAIKKYRGHCVLPSSIMQEFDDVHSTASQCLHYLSSLFLMGFKYTSVYISHTSTYFTILLLKLFTLRLVLRRQ